jgi:beta-fructofuranosidase
MLRLKDQWIWDFWLHPEGDHWHVWYLKADKALKDESLRHWNVSYGHAVSHDLSHWTDLGTCFTPSPSPAWDDKTVWTGSVIRDDNGGWHLFYTGTCQAENGRRQRIGHATSTDGHHWQRVGSGLVLDLQANDAVSALYEEYILPDQGPWDGRAMRDPWVMRHPNGSGWLMYFTARVAVGDELNARGAVGLATSTDLMTWQLQAPVYAGGHYGQLEVPQVFQMGRHWYMVFCNAGEHWSAQVVKDTAQRGHGQPVWGSHYLMADNPLGPWRLPPTPFLDGDMPCRRYAAKVVERAPGDWVLMGFQYWSPADDSVFLGELSDPVPVSQDPNTGYLSLVG